MIEKYSVKASPPTFMQRAAAMLLPSALFFAMYFCWKYFWPTVAEKSDGVSVIVAESALVSILWGIIMASHWPNHSLLVEDEFITSVSEFKGILKWLVRRQTVRKNKIRTIRAFNGRFGMPGGLLLSERSNFGARMMGSVYVPNSLPDYDSLKRLAEQWRLPDQR